MYFFNPISCSLKMSNLQISEQIYIASSQYVPFLFQESWNPSWKPQQIDRVVISTGNVGKICSTSECCTSVTASLFEVGERDFFPQNTQVENSNFGEQIGQNLELRCKICWVIFELLGQAIHVFFQCYVMHVQFSVVVCPFDVMKPRLGDGLGQGSPHLWKDQEKPSLKLKQPLKTSEHGPSQGRNSSFNHSFS